MTEQEMRRRMHQAMDARLSGLQEDPWLAQRVMNQPKGEKKVKRFTIQTVLAMMLLLAIMGTVYAATQNSAPDDAWAGWISGQSLSVPRKKQKKIIGCCRITLDGVGWSCQRTLQLALIRT